MWADSETPRDFLGYGSYVPTLTEICLHPDLAPLTLGIFGPWGSGKTSLMKMLQASIDASGPSKEIQTLWFNAWRYENRDEAQSALIHTILNKLEQNKTIVDEAKGVLKSLKKGASILKLGKFIATTALTLTPDIGGLLDCFESQSAEVAKTMEGFEHDFRELLKTIGVRRLVVFIDDLDRCQSAKVIEIFETIKLFLNIPGTTFVVGADITTITDAVGEVYGVTNERRRKDYLEKIIQIPFNIPEQKLADICCYVGMLILDKHILTDHKPKLVEARRDLYLANGGGADQFHSWVEKNVGYFQAGNTAVADELRQVLGCAELLARGLKGNPRQIKRFLNVLSLRQRLARANNITVDAAMMMKLGVIEYVWEEAFKAISQTIDPSTGHSLLLGELVTGADDTQGEPSAMLQHARADAALVQFVRTAPALSGDLDLRNYLFLAQTALGAGRIDALLPTDEQAKQLVGEIESTDRLRSQSGSKRAAAQDAGVAGAVVRRLLNDLATATDANLKVAIIHGLKEICQKHTTHYETAVQAVQPLEPGKVEGVAIACLTLLSAAKAKGIEISAEAVKKFESVSPISKALGTRPRKP